MEVSRTMLGDWIVSGSIGEDGGLIPFVPAGERVHVSLCFPITTMTLLRHVAVYHAHGDEPMFMVARNTVAPFPRE